MRHTGVALLQLPTGQGKTLITLKAVAELLRRSKKPRPVILVTPKRQDGDIFERALRGEPRVDENCEHNPWARDAFKTHGLGGLCKGKKPKLAYAQCWGPSDLRSSYIPLGAIVIIDEIHRFTSFLENCADCAGKKKSGIKPTPAKRRQYILLSATPINPTRISEGEDRSELTFEQQEEKEDKFIRKSYLNLYKTMISLSFLSIREKEKLVDSLERSETTTLQSFATDLKVVMKTLRPVPDPEILLKLGPKGKSPYQPPPQKLQPSKYHESVSGLLKFHEAVSKDSELSYCAVRMALAGARSRPGTASVGFWPLKKSFISRGHAHNQPGLEYAEQTTKALQTLYRRGHPLRTMLSAKIDALAGFLAEVWKNRNAKRKWRVLVYCAHRGSVSALAAELEKRFIRNGITCNCKENNTWLYGNNAANRIVWGTQGYTSALHETQAESTLIQLFSSPQENCKRGGRCAAGFVLVTSDRLSESISLHDCCEIMVHFDLDWSPLRMIQRFGRLWRIDSATANKDHAIHRPKKPAVFYMVQPGSVDEEILWRLEKRWQRLEALKLGLETVSRKDALGERIY